MLSCYSSCTENCCAKRTLICFCQASSWDALLVPKSLMSLQALHTFKLALAASAILQNEIAKKVPRCPGCAWCRLCCCRAWWRHCFCDFLSLKLRDIHCTKHGPRTATVKEL